MQNTHRLCAMTVAPEHVEMTLDTRTQAAEEAVLDWLEGQANVTRLWIEILVARNGRLDMIQKLTRHAQFLDNAILVK